MTGRVLIVEDDRGNRESLRRILQLDGYQVDIAECWADAFDRKNWGDYFAILLDRKLPDGTADEWLPQMRANAPEAALIVVTAFVDLDGAVAAMRHGADDYLVKPIDGDDVRNRLRRFAEHRATKQALHATEERFDLVVRGSADGIWDWMDVNDDQEWWSPRFYELLGYAPDEIEARLTALREMLHPDDQKILSEAVKEKFENDAEFDVEYRLQTKSGQYRWFRARAVVLRDEAGKPTRMVGSMEDIQDRKAAEEQLHEREARLRSILNTATDAIITFDQLGYIEAVNSAAAQMFGYNEEEFVDMKIDALLPGTEATSTPRRARNLSDTSHDAMARRRDGAFFSVDLAISPMGDGKLFTCIIRDMSHRRALQREVLESAEEERRRIGGDLHDALGQHMTGITYLAETLRDQVSETDPESSRLAARIAELLKETVEQTRRLVRGLYPVEPRPDGLRDALTTLTQRLAEDFRVEAGFACPDDFTFHDSNAANHLFRIAQEASSNAIRHGRSPSVNISIVEDEHWTHLSIVDEGCGFDLEAPPPAGLGLRLMRYRAGLAGGELTVDSKPDSGTSIVCSLPRTIAAAEPPGI